jgi:hypothetical protein
MITIFSDLHKFWQKNGVFLKISTYVVIKFVHN